MSCLKLYNGTMEGFDKYTTHNLWMRKDSKMKNTPLATFNIECREKIRKVFGH